MIARLATGAQRRGWAGARGFWRGGGWSARVGGWTTMERAKFQHGCLRIMRLYCLIVHTAALVLRASLPMRALVRDCCSQRPFPHESVLQSMRNLPECVRLYSCQSVPQWQWCAGMFEACKNNGKRGAWWKGELQEVPLGAENHSLESPNTTLTCQHPRPTHLCRGTFTCICPRTPCLPDSRGANFHTSHLKHVLVVYSFILLTRETVLHSAPCLSTSRSSSNLYVMLDRPPSSY
jgi:hypothetical protein